MRVPMSWLAALLPGLPTDPDVVSEALIKAGLNVEQILPIGRDATGVLVGKVLEIEELTEFKKPIRFCLVDIGDAQTGPRGIVCGARNFAVGDLVAVAVPGAVLPGGFAISARQTYGRTSDGMICSSRELGLGDEHDGILILPPEVAALGADAMALLGDDVLDIDVTPDRGYCMSMRGIARETAIALGLDFQDLVGADLPPATGRARTVRIEDPAGCDRYAAREIRGMSGALAGSFAHARWLSLAGMRPISAVVDATNLVMLEIGQPLHAFDLATLTGDIVVRRARAGERLVTLDGVDRALDPDDLVIADDSGPIALAGVMGGAATEIGPATQDILLEAAHFDPMSVARTARRHRLPSEASRRFERGIDEDVALAALDAVVKLLGAEASGPVTDTDLRQPREAILLPADLPGRIAGVDYPVTAVEHRLGQVGCTFAPAADGMLSVLPPSWRSDLRGHADLVEEVIRLEGYDGIPSVVPSGPAGTGLTAEQQRRRAASRALAASGYVEVALTPFVGADVQDLLGLAADDERRRSVRLANPLSEEEAFLRTTLLPGLLAAAVRNASRGRPDLSLFEMGLVFRASGVAPVPSPGAAARPSDEQLAALDATLPLQPRHAAALLTGKREPQGWWGPGRRADWADAVDAAQTLATAAHAQLSVAAGDQAPWHPGRCAALSVGGRVIGYAGELHPRVIAAFELPERTCAMELDLDALVAAAGGPVSAPVISAFPAADRDVALVVAAGISATEVESAVRAGAGELLESLALFDVFPLPDGRRSLAFRLVLRAGDRTLTADEANAARDAAVARAGELVGAQLRGT
jgi:phenylalanyl-tRNA synthetase beta chain